MVTFLREIQIPEPFHLPFFSELHILTVWQNHMAAVTFLFQTYHSVELNARERERRKRKEKAISVILILRPIILLEKTYRADVIKFSSPKTSGEKVSDFKGIPVILLGSQDVHDDDLFKNLKKNQNVN